MTPRWRSSASVPRTPASLVSICERCASIDSRTLFQGYEGLEAPGQVVALLKDGASVRVLNAGDEGEVILDRTPFYAESGGQVGDVGEFLRASVCASSWRIRKRAGRRIRTSASSRGNIRVGDTLDAQVDGERRRSTALNHSATHLLHAALRKVLGTHVQQKGSLVAPDRLRFDFSHFEPITPAQLQEIERLVNAQIRLNTAAETELMDYESAVAAGAMALFGEKYEKDVRVLRIGDFSMELCGGTHVARSGDIGFFKITSESGVAAGVRRIEAHHRRGGGRLRRAERRTVERCCGLRAWLARGREGQGARCARTHPPDGEGDPLTQGSNWLPGRESILLPELWM